MDTKTSSESLSSATKIVIRDNAGNIEITGRKTETLKVEVTVTSTNESEKKDKSAMKAIEPKPDVSGSTATLKATWKLPKGYEKLVKIDGDQDLRLEITDQSGDITVEGWKGKVVITDRSGDIYLNDVDDYEISSKTSGDLIVDGKKEKYK